MLEFWHKPEIEEVARKTEKKKEVKKRKVKGRKSAISYKKALVLCG